MSWLQGNHCGANHSFSIQHIQFTDQGEFNGKWEHCLMFCNYKFWMQQHSLNTIRDLIQQFIFHSSIHYLLWNSYPKIRLNLLIARKHDMEFCTECSCSIKCACAWTLYTVHGMLQSELCPNRITIHQDEFKPDEKQCFLKLQGITSAR